MADKTSDTGIWLTDDGKVVTTQPKGSASQLVRPGGRITEAVQSRIDSLDADPDAPAISAAEALGNPAPGTVEPAQLEPVKSEAVSKPARRATKK